MTIRSRLLLLLLPPLTAFLILISCFFYLNWSKEILHSFKSRLQSIVVTISQMIRPSEIEWIIKNIHDPLIISQPLYQNYYQHLASLKQKLLIASIYIVQIESVKEGEPVLPDYPFSSPNEIYQGNDPRNAYRQILLLEVTGTNLGKGSKPGENDFSETDERQVYLTKKAFVTPIYKTRKTQERLISAYAPILNQQGEVIALLGADMSTNEIDQKLQHAWLIILGGACITLIFVIITVFLIADRISKPVQQLNQAALEIAAGDYEANVQVKGPKEIVELAHTLNTMSECLVEHISRLRESSLIRERMYGEYECALLLQYYMLQKVVEDFNHPQIGLRLISVPLSSLQKGLSLKIERLSSDLLLTLLEAEEQGFAGLFQLNQLTYLTKDELKNKAFIECQFLHHYTILRYRNNILFPPLVWSIKSQQFIKSSDQNIQLQNRDMIFLYNSSLSDQFKTEENIENWFGRVLRHFADDGLDTIHTMLTHELNFLAKKQQTKRNFQMISIQVKNS